MILLYAYLSSHSYPVNKTIIRHDNNTMCKMLHNIRQSMYLIIVISRK